MKEFYLADRLLRDYDKNLDQDGIKGSRVARRLHALAEIGLTENQGSHRLGFSVEEKQAKELVMTWMEGAGLTVKMDTAGNVFGRIQGKKPNAPIILAGSHVDTIYNGGHFDGTVGVIAALEVAESWKETGYRPEKTYEVVVFTDEEGSRFNVGFGGSEAMVGIPQVERRKKLQDEEGRCFAEILKDIDLDITTYPDAERNLEEIELFTEVHIEQGKILENRQLPVGIVTSIAGDCWMEMRYEGISGHAGNTPLQGRQDALVAAGQFIHELPLLPEKFSPDAVATVGKINVHPNGVNVIAETVDWVVDIRDTKETSRNQLVDETIVLAEKIAANYGISFTYTLMSKENPVSIAEEVQTELEEAFTANQIEYTKLISGAGHDAMVLGKRIPVAMLFVRSKDGIGHHPSEWSDLNDCMQAIHILKTFIEKRQNS